MNITSYITGNPHNYTVSFHVDIAITGLL